MVQGTNNSRDIDPVEYETADESLERHAEARARRSRQSAEEIMRAIGIDPLLRAAATSYVECRLIDAWHDGRQAGLDLCAAVRREEAIRRVA